MAVNSLAQKCCSSTLNLLCQAGAFKRGTMSSVLSWYDLTQYDKQGLRNLHVNETNKETGNFFPKA